jgi:hypothetical protein
MNLQPLLRKMKVGISLIARKYPEPTAREEP